ncbi:MAG TPA: uracil-DNA glycosylase [Roseiarcus sp.]|nr:uracil-DNA glycosylase [Roseiarcus sp.]
MSSSKDSRRLPPDPNHAAETLRWWIRAGVNDALDEAPHDRFAESAAAADRRAPNAPVAALESSPAAPETGAPARQSGGGKPPEAAELPARALADQASDLEALRSAMAGFDGCALKRTATQLVFADGVPGSRVMFVGEAPGGDEDRIGRPFVGRAGQLLDRMLAAIDLDRGHVYIANVVPWRPPGNRTPTLQETQACLPFIRRQIDLANPEILVCLGASAAQTLLGVTAGITRVRGSWFDYQRENGRPIKALAMFHPAYLLRQPAQKRLAWADMRALAKALEQGPSRRG